MSEAMPFSPEQQKPHVENNPERLLETSAETDHSKPDVLAAQEQLATAAKAEAITQAPEDDPFKRLEAAEAAETEAARPSHVSADLRSTTLRRELQQIRRKLPAGDRVLSKVIHQPVIRVVSEGASRSVTRPSGLLGGGLMAFIGSVGYLYLTKHVGLPYNYFVFTLLFVAGFLLGLFLEFIVWTATARRRHPDM
jgi:hypothetical protein